MSQHGTEIDAESSYRVKKPGIDVVASTSEDVCPWELGPEPRSRKNSVQLDSGSSSSDISVTMADVSDRLRRQCGLTQQYTLDGDRRGQSIRKLSTASCIETRRASVSAPITMSREGDRRAASSSEEHGGGGDLGESIGSSFATLVVRSDTSADKTEQTATCSAKTLKKNYALAKTGSIPGPSAPIISVSSVTDDQHVQEITVVREEVVHEKDENEQVDYNEDNVHVDDDRDNEMDEEVTEGEIRQGEKITAQEMGSVDPCCSLQLQQLQLAPLAVPDCESPVSDPGPDDQLASQAQLEAKSNDVCPWEDE